MRTDVLIIGAGPYGIAVAQALWERGVDFRIFGEPFSMWLGHTPSTMKLCSDWRISDVYSRSGRFTLANYLVEQGLERVPGRLEVDVFRSYLQQVLERLEFPVLRQHIHALEPRGERFHAVTSGGMEISAGGVVIATGLGPHRYLPAALRHLPADRVCHSWDVDRIECLKGRSVLVVGGGQSAAETVARLRGHNRVTWVLRRKPRFQQGPLCLPKALCKPLLAFSHRLPMALRSPVSRLAGRAKVTPDLAATYADNRVEKVFGDAADMGLKEIGGRMIGIAGVPFDTVVAATGYRPIASELPFLATGLAWALRNRPSIAADFQSSVPGLFLVGAVAESSFGPAMRLIYGTRLAAQRVGASLTGRAA